MQKKRLLVGSSAAMAGLFTMWVLYGALQSRAAQQAPIQMAPAMSMNEPAAPVAPQTVDILVAASEISIGQVLSVADVRWQPWPVDSLSTFYISKDTDPDALLNLQSTAARMRLVPGEPITKDKIIKVDGAGVMATILRPGMRAVAVPISDVTGAGGFILPGDYVDVLLTRQYDIEELDPKSGLVARTHRQNKTETVIETVRVLAIDQTLDEGAEGAKSALGNTATLELTRDQAELVTLTRQIAQQQRGFITLSLHSFAELLEQFGKDIANIEPRTVLDLRIETAEAEEAAAKSREEFAANQAEKERLDAEDRARKEALLAALEAGETGGQDAQAPTPQAPSSKVILVRNGAPISVHTRGKANPAQETAQ